MMEKISLWLNNNGPYSEGVQLLLECKPKHNLRRFFAKGETVVSRRALMYDLKKVLSDNNFKSPVVNLTQYNKKIIEGRSAEEISEEINILAMPAEIKDMWLQKNHYASEASRLRKGMVKFKKVGKSIIGYAGFPPAEMKRRAGLILDLMEMNQELWDKIRHYQQHGSLPAGEVKRTLPPEAATLSIGEMLTISKNLPSWLSKEKKKIAACSDESEKKERQEHFDRQAEYLKEIREKLKGI